MADLRNKSAPPGWRSNRGDAYFTKDGKHGVTYKCKGCGLQKLGFGRNPHAKDCPLAPTPARVRVEERAAGNLLSFVVLVDGEVWCRVPVWHDDAGQPQVAEARRRADLIAAGLRKVLP